MFTKILVPIDGSDLAFEALDVACEVAKTYKGQIMILSIFRHHSMMERSFSMASGSKNPESLDDVLSAYAKEIVEEGKVRAKANGVEAVRGFVRGGQIAKQILAFAKSNAVDLIVIGTQGQGDLSGYLLGGVSQKVAGLAQCPVLVV
ncbi:MAG: universal stress protein [Campylobacterales bacterium]|nr:universal stress protein [Campylobacterales bacterium]